MNIAMAREVLLWCCAVINDGILLWRLLCFLLVHEWMYRWHSRWFHLSVEPFDAMHYAGMALFKIGILLANLVPSVALHIVR
jgi:hypothetical protein